MEKYRGVVTDKALLWTPLWPQVTRILRQVTPALWPLASPSVKTEGWNRPPPGSFLLQHSDLTSIIWKTYLWRIYTTFPKIPGKWGISTIQYNLYHLFKRESSLWVSCSHPQLINGNTFFLSFFISEFQHSVCSLTFLPSPAQLLPCFG
jgi:hypothetical protein